MTTYRILLSDGTEFYAQPTSDDLLSMTIDSVAIEINAGEVSITHDEEADFTVNDVSVSEKSELQAVDALARRCIVCGSRYYCISGGCANTPCGWICG